MGDDFLEDLLQLFLESRRLCSKPDSNQYHTVIIKFGSVFLA